MMARAKETAEKMTTHARRMWAQCAGIDRTAYIKNPQVYDMVYYRRRIWSVRDELERLGLMGKTGVFTPLGCEVANYLAAATDCPKTQSGSEST